MTRVRIRLRSSNQYLLLTESTPVPMSSSARLFYISFLVLPVFLIGLLTPQGQGPIQFLSGHVHWEHGSPATGLRIELISDGELLDEEYTNAKGYYSFEVENESGLCAEPGTCYVQVALKDEVLSSKSLPAISPGTEVDTIFVSLPED